MKTVIIGLLALILIGSIQRSASQSFGPNTADARSVISLYSGSYEGESIPITSSVAIGRTPGGRWRQFYQWSLPDNIIPDGATVSQVQIHFDVSYLYPPLTQMNFKIVKIEHDLLGSASKQTIFDNADQSGNLLASNQSTVNGVYTGTFNQGSGVALAIESALSQNRFTMAIVYSNDQATDWAYWYMPSATTWPNNPLTLSVWVVPQSVIANQNFEAGNRVENSGLVSAVEHYEGSSFIPYEVPHQFSFNIYTTQTMKAEVMSVSLCKN